MLISLLLFLPLPFLPQVKAINSLGDFVLLVGKILVTSCVSISGFYWFKSQPENGYFYAIPVLITGIISYFVAHSFMSVYEAAVDTLLLCYCHDVDTSDADGIIEDAVKELEDIEDENKKKKKRKEEEEEDAQKKNTVEAVVNRMMGRIGKNKNANGEMQVMSDMQRKEEEEEKATASLREQQKEEVFAGQWLQKEGELGFQVVAEQKMET